MPFQEECLNLPDAFSGTIVFVLFRLRGDDAGVAISLLAIARICYRWRTLAGS